MPAALNPELHRNIADAVKLVNAHSGQASVCLRFHSDELAEVDFVANSASLQGDRFTFTAGFETFDGTVTELAGIRAELIRH